MAFSWAEHHEIVKMSKYNVFCSSSNVLIMLNKNYYYAQSKPLSKIFQGDFTFLPHMFPQKEKSQMSLLLQYRIVHISRKNARN